jgi:hypothetical protein
MWKSKRKLKSAPHSRSMWWADRCHRARQRRAVRAGTGGPRRPAAGAGGASGVSVCATMGQVRHRWRAMNAGRTCQIAPTRDTPVAHDRGHGRLRLGPQHTRAVIVHVEPPLPTRRAERRPIAIRITNATLVGGALGDVFSDDGAAFLSGRAQPNQASFWLRGRESILAHETRSSVLVDPEVSHLLLLATPPSPPRRSSHDAVSLRTVLDWLAWPSPSGAHATWDIRAGIDVNKPGRNTWPEAKGRLTAARAAARCRP